MQQLEAFLEQVYKERGQVFDSELLLRQILEAVQQPTEAMKEAGRKELGTAHATNRALAADVWRAMFNQRFPELAVAR